MEHDNEEDPRDAREILTFRPGAIIAVEGERCQSRFRIEAGLVEESLGTHIIGRRARGDVVPRSTRGVAEVTARALTVVQAARLTGPRKSPG